MGIHKKRNPGRRELRERRRLAKITARFDKRLLAERARRDALYEAEEIPLEELEAASDHLDLMFGREEQAV